MQFSTQTRPGHWARRNNPNSDLNLTYVLKKPPAALLFLFLHNMRVFNVFFCLNLVSKM